MSWFKLKRSVAPNVSVDPMDIVNTKMALNQLGYYERPKEDVFGDWSNRGVFQGIRSFQKDNGLKVDGYMNSGGPTEQAINNRLSSLMFRSADLGALESPAMCACTASDDNPWGDRQTL